MAAQGGAGRRSKRASSETAREKMDSSTSVSPSPLLASPSCLQGSRCWSCDRMPGEGEKALLRCARCRHGWFCDRKCQKAAHASHKRLCKPLALLPELPEQRAGEPWSVRVFAVLAQLEVLLGRRPTSLEQQAVCFTPHCEECNATKKEKQLACCPRCKWGWACGAHAEAVGRAHSADLCAQYCAAVEQRLFLRQHLRRFGSPLSHAPDEVRTSLAAALPDSWPAYWAWRGTGDDMRAALPELFFDAATVQMSQVVTVLAAIYHFGLQSTAGTLTVHLAGASAGYEYPGGCEWEELLHVLPDVTHLRLVFVGPNVGSGAASRMLQMETCPDCAAKGRTRSHHGVVALYHDFATSDGFEKPDVVLALNSGIHDARLLETWRPTLFALRDANIPCCFSSYNASEARHDEEVLRKCGFNVTAPNAANPFRCDVVEIEPLPKEDDGERFYRSNNFVTHCRGRSEQ